MLHGSFKQEGIPTSSTSIVDQYFLYAPATYLMHIKDILQIYLILDTKNLGNWLLYKFI